MPYCKTCEKDYGDGIKHCKACGSKLTLNGKDNATLTNLALLTQSSNLDQKKEKESEQSLPDANLNLHIPLLKSFHTAILKTMLKMSVLKPLAIIIFSFFLITGSYWGYIKYLSVNKKIVNQNPILVKSPQEVKIQSQTPNQVFEIIKQANIAKDIDLFMSCYSPRYKSLNDKKASRLKIWDKYNYNLLKYNIKGFIILKDKASGLVEWEFYAQHKKTERNFSATTLYNVVLEKDNKGAWKILCLAKL